jgi:uncharacterized protein
VPAGRGPVAARRLVPGVTVDSDGGRFTETDLAEATSRLGRLVAYYANRIAGLDDATLDAPRDGWTLRQVVFSRRLQPHLLRGPAGTARWKHPRYSMCYMTDDSELLAELTRVAAESDRLRSQASTSLRQAMRKAADQGLTQAQIARAIGRSQPEVSRLLKSYQPNAFRPTSQLGRLLAAHRDQILALAQKYNVSNVRVFGSVARGEDDPASDIDLLVDLAPRADLFDLASLDVELERLLGRKVDVVPTRLLKAHVAPAALADAVAL